MTLIRDIGAELKRAAKLLKLGYWGWIDARSKIQGVAITHRINQIERPVLIEIGVVTDIPTVMIFGERHDFFVIRINPIEPRVCHREEFSITMGSIALKAIDTVIRKMKP